MLWGSFGIVHLTSLALAIGMMVGIYYLLKHKTEKTQRLVLFILSLSGIAAIIFNLIRWNSPIEYLPFHMCSITAILLPIAILSKRRALPNLLLLWLLGAVFALVMNTQQANYEILSDTFFFYFFPHAFEAGIPVLMFKLGLWKKDFRAIPSTVGLTLVIYTAVHFINELLNRYVLLKDIVDSSGNPIFLNYMYTQKPVVPFMEMLWKIVPHEYFYLLLALPIIVVYLSLVYLPEIVGVLHKKHRAKKALLAA